MDLAGPGPRCGPWLSWPCGPAVDPGLNLCQWVKPLSTGPDNSNTPKIQIFPNIQIFLNTLHIPEYTKIDKEIIF